MPHRDYCQGYRPDNYKAKKSRYPFHFFTGHPACPCQRSALSRPTRRPCRASVLAVRVALVWRAAGGSFQPGGQRPCPWPEADDDRHFHDILDGTRRQDPLHPGPLPGREQRAESADMGPGAFGRPRRYLAGRPGPRQSLREHLGELARPPVTGSLLGAPGPAGTRTAVGARGRPARRAAGVPGLPGTRVRVTVGLRPGCGHLRGRRFPSVPHHRGEVALRFRGQSSGQLIVVRRPGRG